MEPQSRGDFKSEYSSLSIWNHYRGEILTPLTRTTISFPPVSTSPQNGEEAGSCSPNVDVLKDLQKALHQWRSPILHTNPGGSSPDSLNGLGSASHDLGNLPRLKNGGIHPFEYG